MRRISLLCVVAAVTWAQAQAQQSKPLSPFVQELVTNQNQFMQSIAEKKHDVVEQSVAEDFRGIGTNGDYYDRDEFLGIVEDGLPQGLRLYGIQVIRLTEESAVVSYNLIVPGARPRYRHMSDTWAKESGKWKLKFQQYTPNLWSATDYD